MLAAICKVGSATSNLYQYAVTRGPREVAETEIVGDLGRLPNLKYLLLSV